MDQIRPIRVRSSIWQHTFTKACIPPFTWNIFFNISSSRNYEKKNRICLLQNRLPLLLSLPLESLQECSTLHRHCVHTRDRDHRDTRGFEIDQNSGISKCLTKRVVKKLAAKPQANFFSEQAWRRKKKRNEPRPFFRVTRLHCAGLIPRRLVMSRRTARALVTHGKFTFQNRGWGWRAREPSKCTSKLTLHRPSIEPSPPLSLLSSPRAKNGNYCRPTIADLFFFFLHQLVAREPAIYSIFFSHSIPIFAHLRYVRRYIYIRVIRGYIWNGIYVYLF